MVLTDDGRLKPTPSLPYDPRAIGVCVRCRRISARDHSRHGWGMPARAWCRADRTHRQGLLQSGREDSGDRNW